MLLSKRLSLATASKPNGYWGKKIYTDPKSHHESFAIALEKLDLKENDELCEIGCGGGSFVSQALKKVKCAKALDHSRDMLDLTAERNQKAIEEKRLELFLGDAARLPWPDNSFTAAASLNMFFFLPEPLQTLSEVYRVLKPNGRVLINTARNSFFVRMTFGKIYDLNLYDDSKMKSMIKQAGFKNVEVNSSGKFWQVCRAIKD